VVPRCDTRPQGGIRCFATGASASLLDREECYEPNLVVNGLAGLPQLPRLNAAVCDSALGTWHTPRFMLLGFAKCGTSALWSALHRHPQIVRRQGAKETHVFDRLPGKMAAGTPPFHQEWRTEDFEQRPTEGFRLALPQNSRAGADGISQRPPKLYPLRSCQPT
jgi:hypothetical protein